MALNLLDTDILYMIRHHNVTYILCTFIWFKSRKYTQKHRKDVKLKNVEKKTYNPHYYPKHLF